MAEGVQQGFERTLEDGAIPKHEEPVAMERGERGRQN